MKKRERFAWTSTDEERNDSDEFDPEGGARNRSYDLARQVWSCHSASCIAARHGHLGGHVIDLVAILEGCSLREAGIRLSAATGQRTQITWPPLSSNGDSHPAFSPDGNTVAFRRGNGVSVEDVYVVPITGGEPKRVTHDKRGTEGHAWAADGRSIVVASRRDGSFPSLWRFSLSGGTPERLSDEMFTESPAVSRHGNRIAYVRRDNDLLPARSYFTGFQFR